MTSWDLRETFETEAGPVRFDRLGSGPPLVLLHGTPFSSFVWRRLVAQFQRRWTVYEAEPTAVRDGVQRLFRG